MGAAPGEWILVCDGPYGLPVDFRVSLRGSGRLGACDCARAKVLALVCGERRFIRTLHRLALGRGGRIRRVHGLYAGLLSARTQKPGPHVRQRYHGVLGQLGATAGARTSQCPIPDRGQRLYLAIPPPRDHRSAAGRTLVDLDHVTQSAGSGERTHREPRDRHSWPAGSRAPAVATETALAQPLPSTHRAMGNNEQPLAALLLLSRSVHLAYTGAGGGHAR